MKQNTKTTIKIYLRACLEHKTSGFFILASVIIASGVGIIIPLYFKKFFDLIMVSSQGYSTIADNLIRILIYIVGLNAICWVFWRIASFNTSHFQSKVAADLSNQCFAYLHKHSFAFFNNDFVGSLVKRVKWFSKAFVVICDRVIWSLLPLSVNIIVITIILFKRNNFLGFAILGWILLFLLINAFFVRYKLKYDIQRANKESETTAVLADSITNNSNIKLFNGYKREINKFANIIEEFRKIRKFAWNLSHIFEAIQGALMISFEFGLMYLAVRLWQKGILTVGDFVLIQTYLFFIFHRIWDFGKNVRQIYEGLADAEEMSVIFNTSHEIQDVIKAKKLNIQRGKIEFKNVDFYYRNTRKVLENFNLIIKPGERIAFVGPSGSGKTTVVKLLLRMRDITDGQILIDGQNIAKTTQESLRTNISLVPQNPILFHRTLWDNIKYGKPYASRKETLTASKQAHCHEFIMRFDEQYNSFVGERGMKLSGGERQRIAIARAILKNSQILVLDEATSSLDSYSELLIQDAMNKLMENKTVIVIAHRLSTIRKMDRIIVIEDGKIAEQGTHQELIAKPDGKYKKLWQLQAGSFIE